MAIHSSRCVVAALVMGMVACLSASADTTANMAPITPSDPEWGKALTVTSDTVIDAGEGATWSGALTVYEGATLTTRGHLSVAGTMTVNVNGALDIETGTAGINFGSRTMSGALYIRAGAQLNMNRSDAFNYHAAFAVHVYGTFNAQTYRTSVGVEDTVYFHDGARIIGAGDGNGAFDFFDNGCRLFVDGNVACDAPLRARAANYNLNVTCFENAHINFAGGFAGSAGIVKQVAATAEEGNAPGTCANAFIEVGVNPSMTGKFVFISPAAISLKGETQTFTVETSAAELEVRARGDVARANHVLVQKLPTITTSTATVRLVGDGVCAFLDAAPTFPVVFAGASLAIATNAPVALAAGSSVSSNTTIGVEGLEAETAATLLTGVDSSFDVSKVSAQAMFNGVLLGTPAAVSFDGASAVVTAGVAAYDATAWIEPYIETKALVWLDASDAANFEFKDNTFGLVTTWKDKSAYKRNATAYTIVSHSANWGTLSVTNGVPAYCMGACDSGIDLAFSARMTTIRTVFWAMSICRDARAFFLGDTTSYRFHRGGNGEYCYNNNNAIWKNGKIYCDGVLVANNLTTLVPTDRHVYSTVTAANCESNRLTLDRTSGNSIRHGGRELSELIAFDTALSDADRQAIEAYLAAKWMGTNPTAAGTEGTYAVTGDLAVDDHMGGDKNLSFSEGASVTVVNPSSTGAMVATSGAVTIPAGSPLAVNVDASALTPGTYTVIQAGSGITDISQFTPTATVGAGASATFAVVDGKLTMTISVTASVSSQTWRPESSADLVWNTTSPNWLYDGGATGGFIPYVPAFIDGAETATGVITVTGTQTAGPITLTGANDYTFKGDGTLAGGDTVTFGGTGTVTFDGANFAGQDIVITNGQKAVLGFNAGPNSLGTDSGSSGGKVTIAEGSQLNVNDVGLSATSPRSEITHLKTFSIAGDGPDGRGAIVNDVLDGRTSHSYQNCAFRRIELSGDASIGGADRVDLRARSGTAATATPGIYGPGKTLTVKNNVWLAVWNQPIDVQSILIPAGGMFLPVQMSETNLKIPGGITLDGGLIDHYQNTYPTNVPFHVTANGGTFQSGGGASTVKGTVSVASGAALALAGDQNVTYSGAFNANGAAVTHSSSAATYFTGTSEGNLDITQTAGTVYLQNKVGGTVTVTKSAGAAYVGSGFSNSTVSVVHTGGSSGFYTQTAAPIFDSANFNITSGAFDIRPQAAGILDVGGTVNIDQSAGDAYVYGPNVNNEYGMALKLVGSVASMSIGLNSSRPGTLKLKEGSDISTKCLYLGDKGGSASRGRVIIDSGAKVTIRSGGDVRNGHWHTAPATVSTHAIDIAGELDCSVGTVYNPMDTPRAEMYLREGGVLKAKSLMAKRSGRGTAAPSATHTFNYGNGTGAAEGRHWFMMEGGRLEIGTGGILGVCIPGVTKFDFQNGDIVNVGAWGSDYGLPMFYGYDAVGGNLTFDLGSYNVNWHTGLSGASDVTLKGSANFQGDRRSDRMQGAMLGKLTVENTGANDLRTTSAFAGGLTLAPGVNAQVAKYGETNYAYAVNVNSAAMIDYIAGSGWSYPFVSADFFGFVYTKFSTSLLPKTAVSAGRGEFYVPADKAGVWTFAGNYDDNIALYVDGTQVFKTTSWSQVGRGTNTLVAGWHKFTIAVYDGGQPGGPSSDGWGDGKGLGFHVGETTATAASNYIKFADGEDFGDGTKLQVRPSPNVAVWSFCNGSWNATTWPTREDWTHIKCIDALTVMYKNSKASDANTWKSYIVGKTSKFEGWFRVEDDKAGTWTFKAAYDDRSLLKIDGVQVCRSDAWNSVATGTAELSAGWHRWEVRVGESGGGGWGPDSAVNGGNTVSYIAPGDTEKRFDENNLKLAATLGDVALIEPNGIHKDLELGSGATLTSSGTMAMPIFGTLKGTGTLVGAFVFAGERSSWQVAGISNSRELESAVFADASSATFRGLGNVTAVFEARPKCALYYFAGDGFDDVAEEDVADVAVTVTDGEKDYSGKFRLVVKDGRLALANSSPGGMAILLR